ncbi:MAG: hypothetical protein IPM29_01865 [Planctomycetes bacterium]|nr:hypothetical protein [Planctomycetota bacterium]
MVLRPVHVLLAPALVLASAALRGQSPVHPDELAMKPEIDAAIDRGVEYLIDAQFRDGSWGLHGNYVGGRAGLCLYTLLQCGVPREHPVVQRAVAYLDSVEPQQTYAATCMILAYDALRDGREDRIEQFVAKLLDWQKSSGEWAYPSSVPDLSNTQYAALGLWIAYKRDIRMDPSVFLRLVDRLEDYRAEVQRIPNPYLEEGRTGETEVEMAGYHYRASGANQKATGSMTSAAIAVLAICKAGLGGRLPEALRRRIDNRQQAAMLWLAQNFSVARNPNGSHNYYYLYGLERVGALMQTEQIGEHWWYVEGAKQLLRTQRNGAWGDVTDTCFALLFLRRATSGNAPTTGRSGSAQHLFAAGQGDADVRLRGAGQQPLSLWIDGFGEPLQQLHAQYGLRVVSVEYVDEAGHVLGKVPGEPTQAWRTAAFLYREKAMPRGDHKLRARVTLMANDVGPGQEGDVEVVESDWMEVRIRDVIEPWMETVNQSFQDNLLRLVEPEIVASSELDKNSAASNLIDGRDSTRWIAAADDEEPSVLLRWRRPVPVSTIVIMHPAQNDRALAEFDRIGGVEIRFGNERDTWQRIEIGADPLAPMRFELPRSRRLREIEVRFFGRVRNKGRIGMSELILLR